jgi:lipopolysaccharide export LptBFGC system permease protein LptF
MKWLICSLICLFIVGVLSFFKPSADRKGFGKIIGFMRMTLIFFVIGYFLLYLFRRQ